jgi:DNA-binding IclR family transcriptional regulator
VNAERSQSLDRGIALMRLLTQDRPGGWTVTALAAGLGVGRPVVYRLINSLESSNLVHRDDAGVIALGVGVLQFSAAVHPTLRRLADSVLRALAESVGATAHLTIVEQDTAIALAVVEPTWTNFHVSYRLGSRHRIDAGAAGKAVLAGRAGKPGAVYSYGELQSGAHGIAAPVLGVTGFEGSVGVVSIAELDRPRVEPQVVAAATELTKILRG